MKRREFMVTTAAAGLTASSTVHRLAAEEAGTLEKRALGRTGEKLSIIGFGGIVVMDSESSHANRVVAEAFERGINYFDVAPSYGNAQDRLGSALKPYRDRVFLACKTLERSKDGAERELQDSLKKLETDHVDLYQLHALSKMEDLDQAAGPGGALETFVAAREKGLIRFIGFSAHSEEVALAALDRFPFDSVLFPFNFTCLHQGNFGPKIYAKAEAKGVGLLALKALARCPWPQGADRSAYSKCWYQPLTDLRESEIGLRFTLSKNITAAVTPGEEAMFRRALEIASRFTPLSVEEEEEAKRMAASLQPIFQNA